MKVREDRGHGKIEKGDEKRGKQAVNVKGRDDQGYGKRERWEGKRRSL